jgi:16S rRNA (guanine(966)-N(2))-methyltransferase RsmD
MLGDAVVGCVFYDVFAGTGVVGLEALSRGAARVVFIELERMNLGLIRRNLDRAHFGPEATIRGADAFRWADHFVPEDQPTIVFLGPPYAKFHTELARMLDLVETLQKRLSDDDILVFQFPSFLDPIKLPDETGWFRIRTYGKTRIGIWMHGDVELGKASSTQTAWDESDKSNEGS